MEKMQTALIDFDGVIHQYSKGWHDGTAYDPPMPDALEGLQRIENYGYHIVIFSTRDAEQIRQWLALYGFPDYEITNIKRPATFILDDRAIRFHNWADAVGEIELRY